ncbi:MAG: hypothetical protein ACLFNI_01225 [Natronomonas sp.]
MRHTAASFLFQHRKLLFVGITLMLFLVIGAGEVVAQVPPEIPVCEVQQSPVDPTSPDFPGRVPEENTC